MTSAPAGFGALPGTLPAPAGRRVYLLRHCAVDNPRGVVYGSLPGFGLSSEGRRQADRLGEWLAPAQIGHVVSSPLHRAVETARIIAAHVPGALLSTDGDLVETRIDTYVEGLTPWQIPLRRPLYACLRMRPGWRGLSETREELAARLLRAIGAATLRAPLDRSVVLVSHGEPIDALWRVLARGNGAVARRAGRCPKGSGLVLRLDAGRLVACHHLASGLDIVLEDAR